MLDPGQADGPGITRTAANEKPTTGTAAERKTTRPVIPLDPAACRQLVASKRWQKRLEVQANGCWHLRYPTSCGYPRVKLAGRRTKANRIAWVAANGRDAPSGMDIGHTCADRAHDSGECTVIGVDCSHRRCVNPDHLEPQTRRRNTLAGQGSAARNARQEVCPTCKGPYSYRASGRRTCLSCDVTDRDAARRDAHEALGLSQRTYTAAFGGSKYTGRAVTAAIAAGTTPATVKRAPELAPRNGRDHTELRAYLVALALPDELLADLLDGTSPEWAAVG